MPQPNLFTFARSELSQDAVLCWLLSWADASNASLDPPLHATGRALLACLYRLHGREAPPLGRVEVWRQVDQTDVLALVGEDDGDLLVIEDKVDAALHNDLRGYERAIVARHPKRARFLGVYLSTGDESWHARGPEVQGWKICLRAQLLDVLNGSSSTNAILCDFREHVRGIESDVSSWRTRKPRADWPRRAWQGLFAALQRAFPGAGWRYVANPSGGFMGFWLPEHLVGERRLKLQLENERLVVKLIGHPARQRRAWSKHVIQHLGDTFQPPARLGSGNFVTIAQLRVDWRHVDGSGRVDLDATVAQLREWDARLRGIAEVPGQGAEP